MSLYQIFNYLGELTFDKSESNSEQVFLFQLTSFYF